VCFGAAGYLAALANRLLAIRILFFGLSLHALAGIVIWHGFIVLQQYLDASQFVYTLNVWRTSSVQTSKTQAHLRSAKAQAFVRLSV
jgi:hypothetical protein